MLNPREADFFAKAKADGFSDDEIANEIKSRRSAKPPVASAGHGRGDELFQPDPSPSGMAKGSGSGLAGEAVDMFGGVKPTPTEQKTMNAKAASIMPEQEKRANDPIANDPLAQEIITQTAMAGPARLIGSGVGKLLDTAPGRAAGRWIKTTARGASKKARDAIGEVSNKVKDFLVRNPEAMKNKTPAEVLTAFEKYKDANTAARSSGPFAKADAASEVVERKRLLPLELKPQGDNVPSHIAGNGADDAISEFDKINTTHTGTEALTKVEGAKKPTARDIASQLTSLPDKYPKNLGPDVNLPAYEGRPVVKEPFGETQRAVVEPERELIKGRKPGVAIRSAVEKWDSQIAKLSKGTNEEKDIAASLKTERDKFMEGRKIDDVISSDEARHHASVFQKAYEKTATTANTNARREMSKDMLDALREHIKDPELLRQVDRYTDDLSVGTRISKAAEEKAKTARRPGEPEKTRSGGLLSRGLKATKNVAKGSVTKVDDVLAKIAFAGVKGEDVAPLVQRAIQAGATQEQIDSVIEKSKGR